MTEVDNLEVTERRDFLVKLTTALGGVGVAAACIPFIASMNPSADVLSASTLEVDLSAMNPGDMRSVAWQGKPIFILRRTPTQIASMQASNGSAIDPAADSDRVQRAEWLVLIGVCTHMGCIPNQQSPGWMCHCHGSQFDESGRVLRGPAPRNLDLPPYRFIAADKILIGVS